LNKLERGRAAQQLMDNSLLQECFAALSDQYTASWRAARTVEAREDCHRYMTVIDKLKDDIRSIATTGGLERKRLQALEGNKGVITWMKI
jgi:hypothetical protein